MELPKIISACVLKHDEVLLGQRCHKWVIDGRKPLSISLKFRYLFIIDMKRWKCWVPTYMSPYFYAAIHPGPDHSLLSVCRTRRPHGQSMIIKPFIGEWSFLLGILILPVVRKSLFEVLLIITVRPKTEPRLWGGNLVITKVYQHVNSMVAEADHNIRKHLYTSRLSYITFVDMYSRITLNKPSRLDRFPMYTPDCNQYYTLQ